MAMVLALVRVTVIVIVRVTCHFCVYVRFQVEMMCRTGSPSSLIKCFGGLWGWWGFVVGFPCAEETQNSR